MLTWKKNLSSLLFLPKVFWLILTLTSTVTPFLKFIHIYVFPYHPDQMNLLLHHPTCGEGLPIFGIPSCTKIMFYFFNLYQS